jgi:hypothetical protein
MEPRSLAVMRAVGRDKVFVLDAAERLARLTYVSRAETPFTDQVPILGDGTWEAASLMLRRALRGQQGATPPVLLAGELEAGANLPESAILGVSVHPASSLLNGHGPGRPTNMPGGALLAPLGLAMRGAHSPIRGRYPEVNLLAGGEAARSSPEEASRTGLFSGRMLLVTAAVAGVFVVWGVAGVGVAYLLGALPHLHLGP